MTYEMPWCILVIHATALSNHEVFPEVTILFIDQSIKFKEVVILKFKIKKWFY